MNRVPEEMLMAFVDGELEAGPAAEVERAMRDSPEVAAAVARARALRERVRAAYAPVLDEPLPARLLEAALGPVRAEAVAPAPAPASAAAPAQVSAPVSARSRGRSGFGRNGARRRWGAPEWSAVAASLVLGVVVAGWLRPVGEAVPLQLTAQGVVAAGTLSRALDTRSSGPAEAGVAIGLGFRAADGYCRTFVLEAGAAPAHATAGLACRDAGAWRVVALGETAPAGDGLRQAAAALPPTVLAEVDARLGDGEPLDAAGERAALDAGWRVPGAD
ncbi:MAG TPA: hypothetical protein VFS82_06085 [Lysobacter sp.]|nr:hypothetical protein [Lysobacter sp.]